MSEDKAEELLQSSKQQKRHSAESNDDTTTSQSQSKSLVDAVAEAYHDLDDGAIHENLTVRDENLAALVAGLEETGELEAVGRRANEALDRDDDVDTRAGVLKLLLRVGLDKIAAAELDEAKRGRTQYIQERESESEF